MIHQLKCESDYFDDIVKGKKTFEVRKNDRDFHVGDYLALNELTGVEISGEKLLSGRSALFCVEYLLDNSNYCKEGYVVLGIRPCKVINLPIGCEPTILDEGEC